MSPTDLSPQETGKGIARRQFEDVIRRAVELSLLESDAEDQLSEHEVVRIATELGLSEKHARQALYELPELESDPSMFEKYFGASVLTASRSVPGDAAITLRRIEDYLSTREYLQAVRRRHGRVLFMPAEDTISYLARGLLRPSHRFQLARSRRVALIARPLDAGTTHVQIATDMGEQRKSGIRSGIGFGAFGGMVVGAAAAGLATTLQLPDPVQTVASIAAFAGGLGASVSASVAISGARFRARMAAARLELEGLLDRAERGDALEPPPAPWRRRLQLKMLGPRATNR
jgi:hypothetical protein